MPPSPLNVASHLARMAASHPASVAIYAPRGRVNPNGITPHRAITFAELNADSDAIAHGLHAAGIVRGMRTALMVPPSPDFFALTFALLKSGSVPVLIDPGMGVKNLGKCLAEAEPEAFIGIAKAHAVRRVLGWARRTVRATVNVGRWRFFCDTSLSRLRKVGRGRGAFPIPEPGADETAAILFTSGSTGVAKGVIYTHSIFASQVALLKSTYRIEPGEIDLCTFPLFALFGPALGMTCVIPDMNPSRPARIDPHKAVSQIRQFGVTNLFGSPAVIRRLGELASSPSGLAGEGVETVEGPNPPAPFPEKEGGARVAASRPSPPGGGAASEASGVGSSTAEPTPQPPPCREGEEEGLIESVSESEPPVPSPPSLQGGGWGVGSEASLPTLRRVISAGAPASAASIERFVRLLPDGTEVFTPYGATESLPVANIGSREILAETRYLTEQGRGVCVGRPVAGMEVRVIRISDEPIPVWDNSLLAEPGEVGEFAARGPVVTREYYNRPDATRLAKILDARTGEVLHRMGDVGYLDDRGRLWFCGRKAHRVTTPSGTLFTDMVEPIFNTATGVVRTALVGVTRGGVAHPVLCVEPFSFRHAPPGVRINFRPGGWERIERELRAVGGKFPHTRAIETFLPHPGFPVDVRHNSKIFREKLAAWADRRLGPRWKPEVKAKVIA